jgi:hypothetical protein
LLFIIYINDLPPIINTLAAPVIFSDDTIVKNLDDFCVLLNRVVYLMSNWFAASKLTLNLDKINIIKFITYNSPQFPISIGYEDKYIEDPVCKTFLGSQIDSCLNCKTHVDQLVPKLSNISNIDALKLIYFAYFHFLVKYGTIFWGNSPDSKKAFTLQKKLLESNSLYRPI